MEIGKGKEGALLSWQDNFPEETKCSCGGKARIAFGVMEKDEEYPICNLHNNEGKGGFWPHDAIAVTVYFCKDCFKAITLWNQA